VEVINHNLGVFEVPEGSPEMGALLAAEALLAPAARLGADVNVRRQADPTNEFTHNNDILNEAFWPQLMTGTAITKPGTLPGKLAGYLARHHSTLFGSDAQWLLTIANQGLRHAAARAAVPAVKAGGRAVELYRRALADPDLMTRMEAALKDPNGKEAHKASRPARRPAAQPGSRQLGGCSKGGGRRGSHAQPQRGQRRAARRAGHAGDPHVRHHGGAPRAARPRGAHAGAAGHLLAGAPGQLRGELHHLCAGRHPRAGRAAPLLPGLEQRQLPVREPALRGRRGG
jgi:hypothetical protein